MTADTVNSHVIDLAGLLEQHMGLETTVLDIRGQNTWTDFFIITTASSFTHMRGLIRYVVKYLSDNNVKTFNRNKSFKEDKWVLIDCGDFIIHLMTKEAREFYELEKLWFTGRVLDYSSKSS